LGIENGKQIINKITLNPDDILDYGLEDKVSTLTDFQLIGIVSEKVKYPNSIIAPVKAEIEKRKMSPDEISDLKTQYQSFQTLEYQKLEFKSHYYILLFIIIFFINVSQFLSIFFVKFLIVVISIIALISKFEKGIEDEKKIWRLFTRFCLVSFFLALIFAYANSN